MPFGYSNKIFPHPAVEYIPLLPTDIHHVQGNNNIDNYAHPWAERPGLILFTGVYSKDAEPFITQLDDFSLDPDSELGLVLINSQLETVKYRGNYVTVIGRRTAGKNQVVKILTRYFYKPDLVFELVDPATEEVACQRKLTIPTIR